MSADERYNLIGPADVGAAAAADTEYLGHCSRHCALAGDEKSRGDWDSTAGSEGHKSWTSL